MADVRQWLAAHVPQGPWHYPEDEVSDAPVRQLAAEITREKLYLKLHQELPYQSTVETESWTERKDGSVRIEQTIYVERDSQRKIVLGKGGQSIKAIGEAARARACRHHGEEGAPVPVREGARGLGRRPGALPADGAGVSQGMTWRGPAIAALALLVGSIAAALAQDRIHLHTNEAEIGEVLRDGGVAIDDPLAVFAAVLKNLPERVQVYPTENYFYFRFTQNGVVYAGNIRLAAADRDQGKVNFAYNEQPTDWNADPKNRHVVLGREQGVTVEKAAPLTYRVTHVGKDRDLRAQRPVRGQAAAGHAEGRTRHSSGRSSMNPASGFSWCSTRG